MSHDTPEVRTLQERLRPLVDTEDAVGIVRLLTELDLHASDLADLLEDLNDRLRLEVVRHLPAEMA